MLKKPNYNIFYYLPFYLLNIMHFSYIMKYNRIHKPSIKTPFCTKVPPMSTARLKPLWPHPVLGVISFYLPLLQQCLLFLVNPHIINLISAWQWCMLKVSTVNTA